ncbi:molybdenum cofactor guanylyltransferase MobA [Mesorhizobium sp. A623]
MTRILGVILAGGRATRMGGGDKGLLRLGDARLLDHVVARLGPQCAELAINANGDPTRFSRYGLPVIADTLPDYPGPLAGVLAGLDWAAENGADAIVTAAADTPFLPRDLVACLGSAAAQKKVPIALAASPDETGAPRRHPTFGLWPVVLREDLRAELSGGLRKIVLWADRHGYATALFAASPFDPFFNVNTPQDMARAEAILREGAP